MELAALQRALQNHVLAGDGAVVPEVAAAGEAALVRLEVYAYAYGARLREALAESFPALARALGPREFDALAQDFVRAQPSTFASVRDYGEALAGHTARRLCGPRGRVACELARWEWALAAAFDAPDSAVAAAAALQSVPPRDWPTLRLSAVPSLRLLTLRGNAVAWWRWAQPGQDPPSGPRPRWRDGAARDWLVWRQDLTVRYRALPPAEAELIGAFSAGEDFGSLCERLARRRSAGSAVRAARLLQGWLAAGLVASWSIGCPDPTAGAVTPAVATG
jgi:hypothetical protein